jgi:hypothetical protein
MVGVCVGGLLLPWHRAFRSGFLSEGKYVLILGLIGLGLYALGAAGRLDFRWWRLVSVPLAIGCLALSVHALNGYAAFGATVTAVSSVAWLVASRRSN